MIDKIKKYEDLIEHLEKQSGAIKMQLERVAQNAIETLEITPSDNVAFTLQIAKTRADQLTADLSNIYKELNYTRAFVKDMKEDL